MFPSSQEVERVSGEILLPVRAKIRPRARPSNFPGALIQGMSGKLATLGGRLLSADLARDRRDQDQQTHPYRVHDSNSMGEPSRVVDSVHDTST